MWKSWRQRFRDWWTVNRFSKRGLSVGEVFYRLAVWQRWILMIGCFLIAMFWISMPYSVSVMPHWLRVRNADGTFNAGELSTAIGLTGTVVYMALYEFILKSKDVSWLWKICGAFTVALCIWTNSGTGTATQTVAHDQRNDAAVKRNARIEVLKQQVADNTAAWNGATKPTKRTTQAMVDVLDKAAKTIEKRAYDECHTGTFGMTRGPRCAELEKQHATKLEELAKAQADKDATDNLITIEAALSADKEELKTIGPKAEHTDELDGFVLFLTNFGMTSERAKALVANKPATDTLNFEFLACFGVAPSIMLWMRLLAFLTCQTGEAEERVKAVTMAVAEDLANRAVADMPANEIPAPKAKPFTFFDEAKEPEPDHAAALGIEGEDHPAFVSAPKTREEAIAAAFLKVDKTKKPRGARKRTEAHKSSVVQWHKERCFAAPGRVTWSTHARPDYESWCAGLNLEPVNPKLFGMTLRNECGVLAEPKSKGTKYFDIGLRAGGLRIVAG